MSDKIVNHFVLADGSVAKYNYNELINAPDIIDKGFQSVKVSDLSGATLYTGYYGANGADYIELSNATTSYNSIVYYPETDVDIYIDADTLSTIGYVSICVGENAGAITNHRISCTSGTVYRYRKPDSNMPTVSNPLHVKAGSVLVFTETGTANNWTYYFNTYYRLASNIHLSESQVNQAKESTLSEILSDAYGVVEINSLDGATLYAGYYGSNNGASTIVLAGNGTSAYNSYVYFTDKDFDLYIGASDLASLGYVSLCVVESAGTIENYSIVGESGTAVRYRKLDHNMPTVDNPLHVYAGSALVFTEPNSTNNWKYYFNTFFALSENIQLSDSQVEQVENSITDSIDTRKCKLRYVNGAGSDSSTERLEIFIPTVTGYIGYSFLHCYHLEMDVSYGNQNIWRVGYAYAYDNSLSKRYDLTTSGEWEVALRLKDRTDFSGGNAHGDEIFTDLTVLVDGEPLQYDSFTSLTDFDTLTIVERSNLYDPADNTTIIAEHGSEHIFDKNGLTINQSVKWLISDQTISCYMAMLPISKTVSNKVFVNSDFIIESLPNRVSKSNTTSATLYSDTLGVKAVFEIQKYPLSNPSFLCTDNGGGAYNKCYFVITSNQNVSVNERWESTTVYKLTVSK